MLRGARELVEMLRRQSLLAVATNAHADLVQETLADVGLVDSFELIVNHDGGRAKVASRAARTVP